MSRSRLALAHLAAATILAFGALAPGGAPPPPWPPRVPYSPLAHLAAATILAFGALAPGGAPPVPWPHGVPYSSGALDTLLAEAQVLDARESPEEWLDAAESGEASEHLPIMQEDIDSGYYTKQYLFNFGDEFFSHPFAANPDGYGDGTFVSFRRIHSGVRGGLDTFSCAGCHSVGGADGAGSQTQNAFLAGDGDTQTSANARNAPALQGGGIIQAIAF